MSRFKLPLFIMLITMAAAEAFAQFEHWYSPFGAAFVVIMLTALLQKSESTDEP